MADPYIGEIRAFAFDFAPMDWALCKGQSLAVLQNQALFAVIGNLYGGDNVNFKLPNLQGRSVMGAGNGAGLTPRQLGNDVGARSVTLGLPQLATHTHAVNTEMSNATVSAPANVCWAKGGFGDTKPMPINTYAPQQPDGTLALAAVEPLSGGGLPHDNQQPYLTLNLCICLAGNFPVRP